MQYPLCFIVMPFGKKQDSNGKSIDFDTVYEQLIKPAVLQAGMEPIRADEEKVGGLIHKPMYERLILCDYAIADLSTANANVFYELGVRHAVKPHTTISIYEQGTSLPFDVRPLRCLPYQYEGGVLLHPEQQIEALTQKLIRTKTEKDTDSPIYQLVDGIAFQNSVAHEKTDIFREKVHYNEELKKRLKAARSLDGDRVAAIKAIVEENPVEDQEAGVLIDMMLSFRALSAFEEMVNFIHTLPSHIRHTIMVQEQLGFALNRLGRKEEAITVLKKVLETSGPSSETYGILGRVYKDLYEAAFTRGDMLRAESYLDLAIDTYRKGFESDWRDAYPGINAVTLLALKGEQQEVQELAPVVEYAVQRKLKNKTPDYWDYATLLELAILHENSGKARTYLGRMLTAKMEGAWMLKTTMKNLQLIIQARRARQENTELAENIYAALDNELQQST